MALRGVPFALRAFQGRKLDGDNIGIYPVLPTNNTRAARALRAGFGNTKKLVSRGYQLSEPLAGLEPATHALRMRCSTN